MIQENTLEFDELKMYFYDEYKVTDHITIHSPTMQEIVDFGEKDMYAGIQPLLGNPTSYRLQLWQAGIDWNKISDWELFVLLYRTMRPELTSIIFGDFDFTRLIPMKNEENDEIILCDPNTYETIIDEFVYQKMSQYLRLMFNSFPKVEHAKGKVTKQALIEEDEMNARIAARLNKNKGSTLMPLISALINHPGFKYKRKELGEVSFVEFMDSVARLQVYEQSTAFLKGMYSGFMDTSKMSKKDLNESVNWLRDLKNGNS